MTAAIPVVRVVAFGGGHGLSVTLQALAALRDRLGDAPLLDITALVTIADDGGSSGRLRAERDSLAPGDLRQALAALAAPSPHANMVARLFQHRFAPVAAAPEGAKTNTFGTDWLAGHAVGNLVLTGLFDMYDDPVAALDCAASMVAARGRVLPMSTEPLRIEADVRDREGRLGTVFGQHSVAVTSDTVEAVRLSPLDPPVHADAVAAVAGADWLIFGPGSWYTSVIPHLLVPDLAAAILASPARRLVILNLATENETAGLSLAGHLDALTRYLPGLRADVVLADGDAVGDAAPVARAAQSLGAGLDLSPMSVGDGTPRHDVSALASALLAVLTTTVHA
jgi:uncharacterized cofD-like protein